MPTINDTALEKTFSDLAYAHLRDKAPALLDYLVGFQMLKQEDDGQRAVGIFGFEVDKDFYYAPAFFLTGEVRGLESLYAVQSDRFLPLTEGWVDELINRRQQRLGDVNTESKQERGVRVPNYMRLKVIPGGSGAGAVNLKLGSADLTAMMLGEGQAETLDLPTALREAGASGMFKAAMDAHPELQNAFEQFYSVLDLHVHEELQKTAAESTAEEPVVVVSGITDGGIDRLTDEQRKEVLEGGTVVVDDRPEVAKAQVFRSETTQHLTNPNEGGLYDVLWSDGQVATALIAPLNTSTNTVFVYRLDDKRYCEIDSRSVMVVTQYTPEDLRKWLADNAVASTEVKPNQAGVFISRTGEAAGGFCVKNVRKGLDGITAADVRDHYYMEAPGGACGPMSIGTGGRGDHGNAPANMYRPLRDVLGWTPNRASDPNDRVREILVVASDATSPRYTQDKVIVGDRAFFWLKLNTFTEKSDDNNQSIYMEEAYGTSKGDKVLATRDFGDYNTIQAAISKVAQDLSVWTRGSDIHIKVAGDVFGGSYADGMRHLILGLGVGEADARAVLGAAGPTEELFRFVPSVKTAAELLQMPDDSQGSSEGGFMSAFHKQETPWKSTTKAQAPNNREFYNYHSIFGDGGNDGPNTLEVVDKAAETGQKNVFDAAALGVLVRSNSPTDMVDRFLPTIAAGMDRIGRMLFLVYWHFNKFEDRYGEQDLSEFIDNLKAVFEQLGDLILFAKRRQLSGDPDHYGLTTRPMLDDAASSS